MTPRTSRLIVPALAAVLVASLAVARDTPAAPHASQALYAPSRDGLQHFLEDELERLVRGQAWEWDGRRYEVVRLHKIAEAKPTRAAQANRDYDAPVRGWAVAIVHVRVDGHLERARITVNTSYAWQPAGWQWEQVLLYLGDVERYDFVARKVI
jgi:hypothetical protein